ncbi:hypothetical protein BU26DRAFT_545097 [Trematosphaeria pertusa]|uniref:Heterokaryon incompatibility domain-containing protein n=1 Tax=Trematosphaeria pertusa TaxID=390896 RepID=A0A6A6J1Y5_9PLEO|nr:uncharacterized protein BU26DRAFT_545097 [Trematosphaeria pertusa]KAF2255483.1 hypothetical protein BU26DRAFT_545097 [Trematosphaeria pertusa]
MDLKSPVGPLWQKAITFLDLPLLGRPIAIYDGLESALHDAARHTAFRATLSSPQVASFQIIQEWWNCSIEQEEWFAENRDKAKQMEMLKMHVVLDNAPPLVISMVFGIGPRPPRISTYRLEIYRLFAMEFDPAEYDDALEESAYLERLQQLRERAAFYATVQRITFPFRAITGATLPSTCSDGLFGATGLAGRPLGPSIDPCHWLKFQKSRAGYPYFLWHVDARRTVKTEDLAEPPPYLCISHTWGRWRDESQPPLSIPMVPWEVPANTKFRVQDLPERLAKVFPGNYIWLDLFCIPQDRSERSLIEISRQADIFGNATVVIAWLNDIPRWDGLRRVIRWLSEFCLENYTIVNASEKLPPDLDDETTGLVEEDPIDCDHSSITTPWFTSLWTLQEACLRPDMMLYNRNFECLTVGRDTVVTLESLAALLNYTVGSYDQSPFETIVNASKIPESARAGTVLDYEDLNSASSGRQRRILGQLPKQSKGILELWDALFNSGIKDVYRTTPASILTLGHYRQCTSSRAEAIMSVVGTTDWYKSSVLQATLNSEKEVLVMGYYPTEFLNEVVRKVEGPFFASVFPDLDIVESVVDLASGRWVPRKPCSAIGSMLPFTSIQGPVVGPVNGHGEACSHESIRTWLVTEDGSVKITQAGIVASSTRPSTVPIPASIMIPGIFSTGMDKNCDLGEWLCTFRADTGCANFAVSLYQATRKFHVGILLKVVEANKLVKIGTFVTHERKMAEVESGHVDWIVL